MRFKFLVGILGVFVLVGAVFSAYRLYKSTECVKDSDCVLVVGRNQCCYCPKAVSRKTLKINKNLVEYEFAVHHYSELMPDFCKVLECRPCEPFFESAVCVNGKCLGKIKEETEREKVFCQDPRPQFCTMECIVNPPYICGSDGKSHCSECQACANAEVEWYIIQNTPCGT